MDIDGSSGPARLPPQTCHRHRHLEDDRVHFTPVKNSTTVIPRAWERKPSTSFLAGSKSRKVWKRFRSSFNSMKALQQMIGTESGSIQENEFRLEINTGRNPGDIRGTKRRCLSVRKDYIEEESYNAEPEAQRGRSFLETKWESGATRKSRKVPASQDMFKGGNSDEPIGAVDDLQVEENLDTEMIDTGDVPVASTSFAHCVIQHLERDQSSALTPGDPVRLAVEPTYPHTQSGRHGHLPNGVRGVISNIKTLDSIDGPEVNLLASNICGAIGAAMTESDASVVTTTLTENGNDEKLLLVADAAMPKLTPTEESTLVRSALRSSLGGDDTELLNNFLSKAKAKREAKAAEAAAAMIAQDTEEKTTPEQKYPEVIVEILTPDRRALEDLDANSPSPLKAAVPPSKPVDERDENAGDKGPVPASPLNRRSTRARTAKPAQRTAAPTAVRSAFSLRRPKGTEFVFLQRTEAQELALMTRRNTRQNKGGSVLPKYTLQELARHTPETSLTETDEDDKNRNINNDNDSSTNENFKPKKHVCWNDEQLVEFEGGDKSNDEEVPPTKPGRKATTKSPEKRKAASGRTARSQTLVMTGGEEAAAAATTAAPRARRVRRLGPSKPDPAALAAITSTANPSDDSGSPASSPPPSSAMSPVPKRKKLTPKSPKASLLRTPSKVSSASSGSSSDDKPLLGGSRSVKTNLLKVNAGSTPMPRRVRSRS